MADLGYVWEKLHLSVIVLATWTLSVQERLAEAYLHNLTSLEINDFPNEDLQKEFKEIMDKLYSLSEGGEYLPNITRTLSEVEANELIKKIISLYDKVTRLHAIEDQ